MGNHYLLNSPDPYLLLISKKDMDKTKIKILVDVLAVVFGISFLDGVFGLNFSNSFYVLAGIADLVCLVWLLSIVHKK